MRNSQEKKNRKKKPRGRDFKIDNSMVKHITGYGISKHKQVELSQLSIKNQISLLSILERIT